MPFTENIEKTTQSRINDVDFQNIKFGEVFSDHMFVMDYADGKWQEGKIIPYKNFSLSPANSALHYGQSIFEGMKAERSKEGLPILFRPQLNAERFNWSAHRMAMPPIAVETFIGAIKDLVWLDRAWIPETEGSSLYIRPYMFSNDDFIGVKVAENYRFAVFTCPVGPYYSGTVDVYIEDHFVRATQGGTGYAKAAGNYGATLFPVSLVKEAGYDQILWTDSVHHKYVQEIGTMNVFFVIDGKVITPSTEEGTILEGTTRKTIIELLANRNIQVEERPVEVQELYDAHKKGVLQDCFGAGTAAVITHVNKLATSEWEAPLPNVEERSLSNSIKEELVNLKRGLTADSFGWTEVVTGNHDNTASLEERLMIYEQAD